MRPAQPLSPQHTGGSTPSTVSHATNTTWVSSMTSYTPSTGGDESRGRSGWRSGKERVSPRESRVERPAMPKKSSSGNSVPLSELSKRPSNSSLITPPLSSTYSNFDLMSPPTLHRKEHKSSSFSQGKVKIKPLLRKISSQEQTTVDLSRSVAENEGLGIFTNSSNAGAVNTKRGYHTRTSSGVSQVSTNTTSSTHRGAQYVHPMRQTPQSFTPTLAHSRSRPGSTDDHISYPQSPQAGAQSYAPIPSTTRRTPPPPLHVRTYSNNSRTNSTSQLNLNSSTANVPGTPSSLRQTSSHSQFNHHNQPSAHSATTPAEPFNTESMPLTARSSLESAFGRKRSRTNTATTPTDDPISTVQALRAEFYAREAAKEAKYAEAAQRAADKEARRQERREASQRRKSEAAERKRLAQANTGYGYEYENEKVGEDAPLSAIEYSNTLPAGLPVDEELEWIRKGKRPPTQKQRVQRTQTGGSSVGKKAKAVSNGWGLFWFRFKTMWLKLKRGMGMKSG